MNHGWRDLPIRAQVTEAVRPAFVVTMRVWSPKPRLGAAVGAQDALFLPLELRMPAALMVDGTCSSGGGWAGLGPRQCRPGRSSVRLRWYRLSRGDRVRVGLGTKSPRAGDLVDAKTVAQRVVEGDPVAVAV